MNQALLPSHFSLALLPTHSFLRTGKHRAILFLCLSLAMQKGQAQDSQPLISLSRFESFRGNYFLITDTYASSEVKISMSTRYELWTSPHVYFGYSQKTFWNIWNFWRSFPLTEIDFRPEGFFEWRFKNSGIDYVRAGYEHESNGKHAPEWRAWDLLFTEFRSKPLLDLFDMRTRVWIPLYTPPENKDITDYLGYGELEIRMSSPGEPQNLAFGLIVRKGMASGLRNGSVELNLIWPLAFWNPEGSSGFRPQLHIQFWSGVGERLLNYNVPTRSIRMGLHFAV